LATRLGGVCFVLLAAKALAAAPAVAPEAKLEQAKADMKALTDGVQAIERFRPLAGGRAVRASCLAEKLAEARAGVQIGSGELTIVESALADGPQQESGAHARAADPDAKRRDDDVAHALTRLDLLTDRAREVVRAARICVDEDVSAVTVTRVEVEISPGVPTTDPAALPPPPPVTAERPPER
jgi:hypothetical protein